MRQQLLILPLAATVLTVAWLFSVPVANAQTQSPSPSSSEQTPIGQALHQKVRRPHPHLQRCRARNPWGRGGTTYLGML